MSPGATLWVNSRVDTTFFIVASCGVLVELELPDAWRGTAGC